MGSAAAHWGEVVVEVDNARVVFTSVTPSRHRGTVVFCHGWGQGPQGYRVLFDTLVGRGWRVLAPAFPGYGGSSRVALRDGDMSPLERGADRTARAVGQIELDEPAYLVAHSMGTTVAVRVAEVHPDMFVGMMLICPVGQSANSPRDWAYAVGDTLRGSRKASRDQFRAATGPVLGAPALLVATGLQAKRFELDDRLARVVSRGLPTALLLAKSDQVVQTDELVRTPGAWVYTEPGTHGLPVHAPERCADILDNWVLGLGPERRGDHGAV